MDDEIQVKRKSQLPFTFTAFLNVRINSSFRFLQRQISAVSLITSHFLQMETLFGKNSTNKRRCKKKKCLVNDYQDKIKCLVSWKVNHPAHLIS